MNGHWGINIYRNFKLKRNKPIIKIETQIVLDNQNIKIKWLVKAIPKGIKLNKLQNKIKLNKEKIKGNQNKPYLFVCCFTIVIIKIYINSNNLCIYKGIILNV